MAESTTLPPTIHLGPDPDPPEDDYDLRLMAAELERLVRVQKAQETGPVTAAKAHWGGGPAGALGAAIGTIATYYLGTEVGAAVGIIAGIVVGWVLVYFAPGNVPKRGDEWG